MKSSFLRPGDLFTCERKTALWNVSADSVLSDGSRRGGTYQRVIGYIETNRVHIVIASNDSECFVLTPDLTCGWSLLSGEFVHLW